MDYPGCLREALARIGDSKHLLGSNFGPISTHVSEGNVNDVVRVVV